LTGLGRRSDFDRGEVADLRQFQRCHGGIEIEISDPSTAEDLAEFLRGLCFEVQRSGERTLEARFRDPLPANDAAARLELDLYLRVWEAMKKGTHWARRRD
jgi:hypothetical protein